MSTTITLNGRPCSQGVTHAQDVYKVTGPLSSGAFGRIREEQFGCILGRIRLHGLVADTAGTGAGQVPTPASVDFVQPTCKVINSNTGD